MAGGGLDRLAVVVGGRRGDRGGHADDGHHQTDDAEAREAGATRRPQPPRRSGEEHLRGTDDKEHLERDGGRVGEADRLGVLEPVEEGDARRAAEDVAAHDHRVAQGADAQHEAGRPGEGQCRPAHLEDRDPDEHRGGRAVTVMGAHHGRIEQPGGERQHCERR
jgi:hypothetical protein